MERLQIGDYATHMNERRMAGVGTMLVGGLYL